MSSHRFSDLETMCGIIQLSAFFHLRNAPKSGDLVFFFDTSEFTVTTDENLRNLISGYEVMRFQKKIGQYFTNRPKLVCVSSVRNKIPIVKTKKINLNKEYDGERNDQKQRHGKGRALLPNSDYFDGYYKEGLRHGEGHYVFKGKAQYRGEYKQGMKDGKGTFYYPDGSTYEGYWKEDKRHGQGKYTYAQGDVYDGDWESDERHGLGTYIYKMSEVVMFGIWEKGKMEGRGNIKYPTFTFHGRFLHNMPIGKGCFVFENYCIQEGHYVHIRDETAAPQAEEGEEMVGGEEEEKLSPREGYPKGIVPVWRPRKILPYKLELIPRDPKLPPKPPASEAGEEQLPEGEELEEALPEGEEGLPEGEEGKRESDTGSARQRESLKGNEELMPIQEESSPENMSPRTDTDNPEDTSPELTDNTDGE